MQLLLLICYIFCNILIKILKKSIKNVCSVNKMSETGIFYYMVDGKRFEKKG